MDNQTGTTGAMSGGAKMVIGAIVAIVVIGGAVMLFSKDSEDVVNESAEEMGTVEKTEATAKTAKTSGADQSAQSAQVTTKTAPTPAKSTTPAPASSITSTMKATEVMATGKDTICTSRVIPNADVSNKYSFADGNARIDGSSMGIETHVIILKSGKTYQWGSMYEGVLSGGQYDASAKMLLQMPLMGYTCVEQDVSAGVFVPPAK